MPDLSGYFTPLVRNLLLALAFVLAIQWGVGQPFIDLLAWHSLQAGFRPWQPITSLMIASPRLSEMLFDWLVIVFSLNVVQRVMGGRALLNALAFSTLIAVLLTALLDIAGLIAPSIHGGQGPIVTALLTLFCFSMPQARVMLLFVVPVQASWMGWLTGVLAAYLLAANRDLGAALMFGGWIGAVMWTRGIADGWQRRLKLRWQRHRIEQRMGRFSVIEGGRSGRENSREDGSKRRDDWIN